MKRRLAFLLCVLPGLALAATPLLRSGELAHSPPMTLEDLFDGDTVAVLASSQCAPCRHEMKALPRIARAHPETTILLIDLDAEAQPRPNWPANIRLMHPNVPVTELMDALGDRHHALPYSVRVGARGQVCGGSNSPLGIDSINPWSASC